MQLMNKKLWVIVKRIETTPRDLTKILKWQSRYDKVKAIIGLALSDSELHHINFEESSKVIWENLSKLFGAQAINAKFSLKLQLFRFKMSLGITMSSHINKLRSLIRQLAEVQATIDEDYAKAILLNSLSSQYENVVFTLSQNSQPFEEMIVALLSEEKRTNVGGTKDDPPSEMALYSRYNRNKSNKDKGEIECYYCNKMGHTAWNCRFRR